MATGTLRIRPGRLADLPQVREFTRDTFSWGDYLPGVWTRWVRTERGELLVAVIDKQVVGTINVRYMGHREAWLEGVRVRAEFRQRGIAGLMVQEAHEHAVRAKCRVIRLETSLHNAAAQRTFAKFGYRRVAFFDTYKSAPQAGTLQDVRLAKSADLKRCWELWEKSWMRRATHSIVPAPYGWRWWELTRTRLADEIRAGRAWRADDAFLFFTLEEDHLDIKLVVGAKRGVVKLLQAARVLAHQEQKAQALWMAPHNAQARKLAVAADYELDDDDYLIYARSL